VGEMEDSEKEGELTGIDVRDAIVDEFFGVLFEGLGHVRERR